MGKNYSPCIDICKYREDGHCSGCSMTKTQKKISKSLNSKNKQLAFIGLVKMQQAVLGGFSAWETAHKKKYRAKDCGDTTNSAAENYRPK